MTWEYRTLRKEALEMAPDTVASFSVNGSECMVGRKGMVKLTANGWGRFLTGSVGPVLLLDSGLDLDEAANFCVMGWPP